MNKHYPQHDWKKYLIVFLITLGIFLVAIYLSSSLSNKRFVEMRAFQDKLTTDILSSETRFALLERTSCDYFVDDEGLLSEELSLFGSRLATMESNLNANDPAVEQIKRYYSLLQIKDYLLVTQLAEKCDTDATVILYFYKQDCTECQRQGYILDHVQKDYEDINFYAFDYNTELSAVSTLLSTLDISDPEDMPVLVINDKVYRQGVTEEQLRNILDIVVPEEKQKALQQASDSETDQDDQ
jgi:thiol-disulfide isomerase/thioredoxin